MLPLGQIGRRTLEVEIVLRFGKGRVGRESIGAVEIDVQRNAERLRKVRLFRIDAGEHRHLEIVHF